MIIEIETEKRKAILAGVECIAIRLFHMYQMQGRRRMGVRLQGSNQEREYESKEGDGKRCGITSATLLAI